MCIYSEAAGFDPIDGATVVPGRLKRTTPSVVGVILEVGGMSTERIYLFGWENYHSNTGRCCRCRYVDQESYSNCRWCDNRGWRYIVLIRY